MAAKKANKSFVCGLIFFVLWVFMFAFLVIAFQEGSGQATQEFLSSHLETFGGYISFEHMQGIETLFTILIYFVILLMILLSILWIVFAVKSKSKGKAAGFLLILVLLFPGLETVSAFYPYAKDGFLYYTSYYGFLANPGMGIAMKIFIGFTLAFALLSFLFGLIFAIKGIAGFAKKNSEATEAEIVGEERTSMEEIAVEREAEEARLAEVRAEREREEAALRAATEEKERLGDRFGAEELKELIREVVREELDKRGAQPQIIQNFYGVKGAQPLAQEEPVEEQPVEEPQEEAMAEASVEEAVVEQIAEEAEEAKEKKSIIRIPFQQRMLDADQEMKDNYSELKNELLSWGLKSRISSSGDSFRLHCKTYCKISIAGKSLKLYLALDPKDYIDSTLPIQNAGDKNIYQEIPLVFKVRSGLSMRRAKTLIRDACEKDNLEQGIIGNENWAEVLKNASAEKDDAEAETED